MRFFAEMQRPFGNIFFQRSIAGRTSHVGMMNSDVVCSMRIVRADWKRESMQKSVLTNMKRSIQSSSPQMGRSSRRTTFIRMTTTMIVMPNESASAADGGAQKTTNERHVMMQVGTSSVKT